MRIDVYGHCGELAARRYDPAHVQHYLDTCAIDRLLLANLEAASEPDGAADVDEATANLACLECCRADRRLMPMYWVRLGKTDNNLHALAGALEIEPFVAVFFAPALNGFPADAPELDACVSVAGKLRRPVFFLTGRDEVARPSRVYELARRHRGVSFVLCGAGGDTRWHEAVEVVARAREQEDARLALCTAGAGAEDIIAAAEKVGGDHLLFGSDATRDGDRHAEHVGELLEALRQGLPADVFANLVGENARRRLQVP